MVTPGVLISRFAEAVGLPEKTLMVHARNLREANLLTTGARGRNAPATIPRDAARLAISVLHSPDSPSRALDAVKDFGGLVLSKGIPFDSIDRDKDADLLERYSLTSVLNLDCCHNFEDVVTAIIEYTLRDHSKAIGCDITIVPNMLEARIRGFMREWYYIHPGLKHAGTDKQSDQMKNDYLRLRNKYHSEIQTARKISSYVILKIADIFAENE